MIHGNYIDIPKADPAVAVFDYEFDVHFRLLYEPEVQREVLRMADAKRRAQWEPIWIHHPDLVFPLKIGPGIAEETFEANIRYQLGLDDTPPISMCRI